MWRPRFAWARAIRKQIHIPKDKGIVRFFRACYEDAASAFEESIASNPEYAASHLLRAASLALAGNDKWSCEALLRYLALNGTSEIDRGEVKHRQLLRWSDHDGILRPQYTRASRKAGMLRKLTSPPSFFRWAVGKKRKGFTANPLMKTYC